MLSGCLSVCLAVSFLWHTPSFETAVKVAESMQQQVTAKRSEIDTLQSDIHWLKECLDITRKVMLLNNKLILTGLIQWTVIRTLNNHDMKKVVFCQIIRKKLSFVYFLL